MRRRTISAVVALFALPLFCLSEPASAQEPASSATPKSAAPDAEPLRDSTIVVITFEKEGKIAGTVTVPSVSRAQLHVNAERISVKAPAKPNPGTKQADHTTVAAGKVAIRITRAGREIFSAEADKATIVTKHVNR